MVREALGEHVTADELGGPAVHSASGVVDLVADSETDSLRVALKLLDYLPDNHHAGAPRFLDWSFDARRPLSPRRARLLLPLVASRSIPGFAISGGLATLGCVTRPNWVRLRYG